MDIKVPVHSSIIINKNIYIDPYNLKGDLEKARYIFITHSHYDHFSLADIKKIVDEHTIFIATIDCCEELYKNFNNEVWLVEPNKSYIVGRLAFSTFAAYNVNKKFHPRENGWVGYNLLIDGIHYVICGDIDITPELKKQKADILFVPIGGTYTMDVIEAANLTNALKPKLVVPVHYGSVVGTKADETTFVSLLDKSINVLILIK